MCIRKNKKKNNICSCKIKYLFRQIGICVRGILGAVPQNHQTWGFWGLS